MPPYNSTSYHKQCSLSLTLECAGRSRRAQNHFAAATKASVDTHTHTHTHTLLHIKLATWASCCRRITLVSSRHVSADLLKIEACLNGQLHYRDQLKQMRSVATANFTFEIDQRESCNRNKTHKFLQRLSTTHMHTTGILEC